MIACESICFILVSACHSHLRSSTTHAVGVASIYSISRSELTLHLEIFDVRGLSTIEPNEGSLSNLVMNELNMKALRAVCETKELAWNVDFIGGKGDGQVVLLYGKSNRIETGIESNLVLQVLRESARLTRLVSCIGGVAYSLIRD